MAGWCCCDHWEKWEKWKPGDLPIAEQSLRDQIYRLRAHPSVAAWHQTASGPSAAARRREVVPADRGRAALAKPDRLLGHRRTPRP
jgi:hypothetical protein